MIGFFKKAEEESERIWLLSLFCRAKNVPFCHFTVDDVKECIETGVMTAKRWNGEAYEEFRTTLPPICDRSGAPFPDSQKKYVDWVSTHSKELLQHSLPKEDLPVAMYLSGLGEYAIPTYKIGSYDELLSTAKMIRTAILKPSHGKKGYCIYKLYHNENDELIVESKDGAKPMTEELYTSLVSAMLDFRHSEILLQPFLDFTYDEGRVIDFRLFRQKGAGGQWQNVATFGRIGSNAITSNFHTGGSMIEAEMALKFIAPEKADELLAEIMMLGEKVPAMIEKFCGEGAFCIGLDVAIDRQTLHPYVIEANVTPGLRFIIYQYAEKRVDYYKYLLSQLGTTPEA